MSKITLIYLMGAGRSGTTALATFLGANKEIQVLGEMHQFFNHIKKGISCSCGEKLVNCKFWSQVIDILPEDAVNMASKLEELTLSVEAHSKIIHHLLKKDGFSNAREYQYLMEAIFQSCKKVSNKNVMLDSAKYISRALALRNMSSVELKVIYMVRDVRGVAHSFSKKVQSSRGTISSILYYSMINIAAEVACSLGLRNKVIKVRYEDMMNHPIEFFNELEEFLGIDLKQIRDKIEGDEAFEIEHIIGGNRLKEKRSIKFRTDVRWVQVQSKAKQVLIYFSSFPLMIINRYPIFHQDK